MDFLATAKRLPWARGVRVLKVDENGLLAIEKPAGLMSHPNRRGDESKSALVAPYDADEQAFHVSADAEPDAPARRVYLLNRLDSATSGVLLLSLELATAKAVLQAFERKQVKKVYEALVFGMPRKGPPTWVDRLSVKHAEGGVRAAVGGGLSAETKLLKVEPIPGVPLLSRLTLMPLTGRTHQLRIQTSKRGSPIVGDRTYGDFQKNKLIAKTKNMKRLCLHCVETTLSYRIGERTFTFSARSPSGF